MRNTSSRSRNGNLEFPFPPAAIFLCGKSVFHLWASVAVNPVFFWLPFYRPDFYSGFRFQLSAFRFQILSFLEFQFFAFQVSGLQSPISAFQHFNFLVFDLLCPSPAH
jgi:hypothetical protein